MCNNSDWYFDPDDEIRIMREAIDRAIDDARGIVPATRIMDTLQDAVRDASARLSTPSTAGRAD
jgi:hypothetical protein